VPGRATAEYVAVVESSGELAIGLADMSVLDALTPSGLAPARAVIGGAALVFADCNLPGETLADLIARRREGHSPRLAMDAVSAPKVVRLPSDLTGLDLLFLNEDEAAAFLDRPLPAAAAATALRARGADVVVLTCGSRGVVVAEENRTVALPAAPVPTVTDVTGAGDALVAATLHRLSAEDALLPAVWAGLGAAALTLECAGGVRPDLSPALVDAALHRARLPSRDAR
jgi:sugar/nucleoside kinase (ribokinase family)